MPYKACHENVKNAKGRNIHYEDGITIRKYEMYMKRSSNEKGVHFVGDVVQNLDMKPKDKRFSITLSPDVRNFSSEEFIEEMDTRFETMSELKASIDNNVYVSQGVLKKKENNIEKQDDNIEKRDDNLEKKENNLEKKDDNSGCFIFIFVVFVLLIIATILTLIKS